MELFSELPDKLNRNNSLEMRIWGHSEPILPPYLAILQVQNIVFSPFFFSFIFFQKDSPLLPEAWL